MYWGNFALGEFSRPSGRRGMSLGSKPKSSPLLTRSVKSLWAVSSLLARFSGLFVERGQPRARSNVPAVDAQVASWRSGRSGAPP